jgi:hypothetical protein
MLPKIERITLDIGSWWLVSIHNNNITHNITYSIDENNNKQRTGCL